MAAIFQIRRGSGSVSLADGELYLERESGSLQVSNGVNNPITLVKLNEMNSGSLHISGNVKVGGDIHISGNLFLGNQTTDTITTTGEFTSHLIPNPANTYDLGDTNKVWRNIYANNISASSIASLGNVQAFSASVDLRLDNAEWTGSNHEGRMDLLETAMSGSKRLYVSPEGLDTNDGTEPHKPFKTIKAAVASLGAAIAANIQRTTIFVGSGNYTENNPIALPPGVAIVGDNLRTVRLTAQNPRYDFFHVHDGNYLTGLRFLDLQYPSFAVSYPSTTATASVSGGGAINGIGFVYTHPTYSNGETVKVIVEGPDAGGVAAEVSASVAGGVLSLTILNGGSGYAAGEKPHISIQPPTTNRPFITTSPYIQNCSSITGPFTNAGVKISNIPGAPTYRALPYDYSDVDVQGAGGGIRIDGNLCSVTSPLRSMVADAFTQVNQGGPGHLVINNGYTQFVSCFTTFCTYGFKVANGGFANISNSVIDFGIHGLVSKTYYPETYNTATAAENLSSNVVSVRLNNTGSGYTPNSTIGVSFFGGNTTLGGADATAYALSDASGNLTEIVVTYGGTLYTEKPNVVIAAPTGAGTQIQATTVGGKAEISNINNILINVTDAARGVDVSSNMRLHGQNYLVTSVTPGVGASYHVSLLNITDFPAPAYLINGEAIQFYNLSNISTGGMVMEYVGSGVTYNALPFFGGIPNRNNEVQDGSNVSGYSPGRVFYTTVDNIGNLKIGDYFAVNQLTGEVTINAESFNLSGLNSIGPFRRNGFDAGVVLNEVSNNITLINSIGDVGQDTVPTQFAVKGYVDPISASLDGRLDNIQAFTASISGTNAFTASTKTRLTDLELTASNHETRITDIQSYTSSLKTAIDVTGGNTRIIGNLIVDGTQTSLNTTETFIEDKSITLASGSTTSGIADGAGLNIAGANVSMSWEDSNQRLYFNTNIGVSGSISASINGIGNVSSFSQSVATQFYGNVTSIAGIQTSITNLNVETASIKGRLDNLESKSASVDIKISNLTAFTGSLAGTNAWTSSINTKFDALGIYTSSVESKFSALRNVTASLNNATASLYAFTASIFGTNAFTASTLTTFTELFWTASNHEYRLDGLDTQASVIGTYTSSVDSKFVAVGNTTSSLLSFSSSFNPFSQSVDARLDEVEYTASISVGAGLAASFTIINQHTASMLLYTGSTNARLNSIEAATASYETTGRGIVSGSSQVTPLLPIGTVSGSSQITYANISSIPSGIVSGSSQITLSSTTGGDTSANVQFGSLGIGTAASGVSGEIRATGDITAFYSSDIRLKENIVPIENALEKVESISGNTYDWKAGYEEFHSHKGNDVGVIAQEIETILPQIVTNRDNGYKAVQYEKIIPLLIEAIKELSAKVDRLENK